MAFQVPQYSRRQVRLAGDVLRDEEAGFDAIARAMPIINNWRSSHAYPLNTFQATLRKRLRGLGMEGAPVGQRLKRLPSIAAKLRRFPSMSLERMQDIAGLRAVVPGMRRLESLYSSYLGGARFLHELRNVHNYVENPKADGYRSIHLIYRYVNPRAPQYDGLHVELQLRTKMQHAWATAVETVDTFAKQAIKAGRPDPQWAEFFKLASAAFAISEKAPLPAGFHGESVESIHERLCEAEAALNVLVRLRGFSVAANHIHSTTRSSAAYHLVVLNTDDRMVNIRSFAGDRLDDAAEAYAAAEERAAKGEPLDAVLVAGGNVDQLRKAYPNYFLDASLFLSRLQRICVGHRDTAQARVLKAGARR